MEAKTESSTHNAHARKPHIIVAATGSVAAIKLGILAECISEWAEVKVVATEPALKFINSSALPTNCKLYTDADEWKSWNKLGDDVLHISLRQWADAMVIAPLSANSLAKIAGGLCDNLLTCIVRAWDFKRPIFVAPAMNTYMWESPFTQKHLKVLCELGINVIPPIVKTLACGDHGIGAMAEPSIIDATVKFSHFKRF